MQTKTKEDSYIVTLKKAGVHLQKMKAQLEKTEEDYWSYIALAKTRPRWEEIKNNFNFLKDEIYSENKKYRKLAPSSERFDSMGIASRLNIRRRKKREINDAQLRVDEIVQQGIEGGMEYSDIAFALNTNKGTIYNRYKNEPWFKKRRGQND